MPEKFKHDCDLSFHIVIVILSFHIVIVILTFHNLTPEVDEESWNG